MPDASLDLFHFLRPWWLLLIPAAIWLHVTLRRAVSAADQWQGIIAPELLEHLVVGRGSRRRLRLANSQLQTAESGIYSRLCVSCASAQDNACRHTEL